MSYFLVPETRAEARLWLAAMHDDAPVNSTTRLRAGQILDALAQTEQMRVELEWVGALNKALNQQNDRLVRQTEQMREALGYYADERHFKSQPTPDADRGFYPTYVPVLKDGGKKARAALAAADLVVEESLRQPTPESE